MSTPISLTEQGKTLKDLINHLTTNLEVLSDGGESDEPEQSESNDVIDTGTATALYDQDYDNGVLDFDDLEPSVYEVMDAHIPVMDSLLHGKPGCFSEITNELATSAELTPTQTASVNKTIQYLNALSLVTDDSVLPMTVSRTDAVGMMSASIAVNIPIASIGIILRLLALLKKIYDLLRKLWKVVFGMKQHVNKIKQAKRLKDAGKITAGKAAKAIAAHTALLAEKIASALLIAKALKDKIKELREEGKDEEADALQKRLEALEKQIEDAQKELEKAKGN